MKQDINFFVRFSDSRYMAKVSHDFYCNVLYYANLFDAVESISYHRFGRTLNVGFSSSFYSSLI